MSAVNDNSFITIQGWMRTKLNLKGNELFIYALIYGFSQDGNSKFSGTRRYIAEWCGCSMKTVDNTITSLLAKRLIVKHEKYVNGIRVCDYTATPPEIAARQNDTQAPADTAEEHDAANPQPLIAEPQTPSQPKTPDPTEEVINHLNQRAGTHYKATTASTRKLIKARLNEGFTIEDMKLVTDKKTAEWLGNASMEQYLRPETLFGNKFESYLNARTTIRHNANANANANASATAYANANGYSTCTPIDDEGHLAECTRENGWF